MRWRAFRNRFETSWRSSAGKKHLSIVGEALHRNGDLSSVPPTVASAVSMLTEVDPLPRPERELAVRDGDVDRCPDKGTLSE